MIEGIWATIGPRLPAALAFGLACGGLSWTLGLARKRASLLIAATILLAFLGGGWAAPLLLAGAILGVGVAARLIHTDGHTRLRLADAAALTTVPTLAALGQMSGAPVYWQAAFTGALAAGCGARLATLVQERLGQVRQAAPSAAPPSGAGLFAAAIAVVSIAFASYRLDLSGPGDGGAVLVAAIVAIAVHSSRRTAALEAPLRLALASVAAAPIAAALAAFLP